MINSVVNSVVNGNYGHPIGNGNPNGNPYGNPTIPPRKPTNIQTASRFAEIDIPIRNTLVLCDIDDTVLTWGVGVLDFVDRAKRDVARGLVRQMHEMDAAYNYYGVHCQITPPFATDLAGFLDMVSRAESIGGTVAFLTARSNRFHANTHGHLREIGIDRPEKFDVHYTANSISKGEYISRYIDTAQYGAVVFIDDLDANLESVGRWCPAAKCVKFAHEHKRILP